MSPAPPPALGSRRPSGHAPLDAWRGVAILAVFAFHAVLELNLSRPGDPGNPGWLGALVSAPYAHFLPLHLGAFGVQLFFVISGYCIHRSVRAWDAVHPGATARDRWRSYAQRRFWRIYPLYAVVLLALFAAGASPPRADVADPATDLLVHAAMLHTLVPDHINLINPSFWSLAVEAQIYALYPLVWLGFRRWGAARVLLAAAALAALWHAGVPHLTRSPWVVNLPWRWGFEWALGAFVAETLASHRWPRGRTVAAVATLATVVLAPLRSPFLYAAVPPIVFALVVAWAARRSSPPRPWRPLAALGRVSYALYLVHQPTLAALGVFLVDRGVRTVDPLPFAATAVGALAVATAAAVLLERFGRAAQRYGARLDRSATRERGRKCEDESAAVHPQVPKLPASGPRARL